MKRPVRRLVLLCALASMALPSAYSIYLVQHQAPALRPSLAIKGPDGSDGQRPAMAMYDEGAYLFQTAYDNLFSDALSHETLSSGVAAENLAEATELFREALRKDPANAHVWQGYAQSLLFADGQEQAFAHALTISAELSPTSTVLAALRVATIKSARSWARDVHAFDPIFERDMETLRRHAPRSANRLSNAS